MHRPPLQKQATVGPVSPQIRQVSIREVRRAPAGCHSVSPTSVDNGVACLAAHRRRRSELAHPPSLKLVAPGLRPALRFAAMRNVSSKSSGPH